MPSYRLSVYKNEDKIKMNEMCLPHRMPQGTLLLGVINIFTLLCSTEDDLHFMHFGEFLLSQLREFKNIDREIEKESEAYSRS